ncbi:MAG: bacillithiol system redox-active protein YtxJ [Bacteroidota bacterium]
MLSGLFSKSKTSKVDWSQLKTLSDLEELHSLSHQEPVLIFKHSTRCAISSMVLSKFQNAFEPAKAPKVYLLDLIANREVSNAASERYGVIHESPQAILVFKGEAVYNASHTGILFNEIAEKTEELKQAFTH